ncbi:MAG: prepilin-type N-terminal cleavage/methylation domain-containing protein [bacterium]|jgi:hypothetical protein|nr:prepilin-type N-terminal cleavage/methylation domain-containing protein [bacterium]
MKIGNRGLTIIELLISLAIGLLVIGVVIQVQRTGILGHRKGTDLAAATQSTYLLLEHLKKDARSALTLENVPSSSAGTVKYRIGRVVYDPRQSGSVAAVESRYSFNRAQTTVRRQEYNLSTHLVISEKKYVFGFETFDFELSAEADGPIKIGLKVKIDGADRWLRLKVSSAYTAAGADRWIYHTIPREILQYQQGAAGPIAYSPPKLFLSGDNGAVDYDVKTGRKLLEVYARSFTTARHAEQQGQ